MIIYKFVNKSNGKIYIGKTILPFEDRVRDHIKKNKTLFQKDLVRYGVDAFDISVIDKAKNVDELNDKEMFWICFYGSRYPEGYNCTDGGDGGITWLGPHSEETLQKMRGRVFSEEHKKKLRKPKSKIHNLKNSLAHLGEKNPNYGKILSEETRRKMREAAKHRPPISDETRKKRSESLKKYWQDSLGGI